MIDTSACGALASMFVERRRALDRADLLAVQVVDALDRGVVALDHDVLPGHEVRPGEVDQLLAGVVDRVGRDDDVDRRRSGWTTSRTADTRLLELDLALDVCRRRCPRRSSLAISTSKPSISPVVGFFRPEAGLVELGADDDLARSWILAIVRAGGERRRVGGVWSPVAPSPSSSSSPQPAPPGRRRSSGSQQPIGVHSLLMLCSSFSGRGSWTGSPGPARSRGGRRTGRAARSRRCGRSSMNATRRAAERAKPISWVTTTMVVPPRRPARSITSSTSLIISGSRAEVGSSNSISLGSMASARAMAARCCWPPESSAG